METTFLYSVHPKKVIKELPTLPIRAPKSLYLTKDQVKICLKYGSVYRRFANEQRNERVTVSNVDRLHNEKFMTEEQYNKLKDSLISDQRGSVIQAPEKQQEKPVENTKSEDAVKEQEPTVVNEPTVVEETSNNEAAVEETVVEKNDQEEAPAVEENVNVEQPAEDTKNEDAVKEQEPKNNDSNKNNYGGKNNKHRK